MTVAELSVQTDGSYRDRIVAVEPGGNEFIAEADRHGHPHQLFWTWSSPNLEFATIFVGVLAVAVYGMNFWQAVAGIAIGTGLGRSRISSCPPGDRCTACRRWCWAGCASASRATPCLPC
jgi:hypothetical protein